MQSLFIFVNSKLLWKTFLFSKQCPLLLFFACISPQLPPNPVLVKQGWRYFGRVFTLLMYTCLVFFLFPSDYTLLHKCSHLAQHRIFFSVDTWVIRAPFSLFLFSFLNKASASNSRAQAYNRRDTSINKRQQKWEVTGINARKNLGWDERKKISTQYFPALRALLGKQTTSVHCLWNTPIKDWWPQKFSRVSPHRCRAKAVSQEFLVSKDPSQTYSLMSHSPFPWQK